MVLRSSSGYAIAFTAVLFMAISAAVPLAVAAPLSISLDSDTLAYSAGEDATGLLGGSPYANVVVTVINSTGGMVSNTTVALNSTGGSALKLNTTELPQGSYVVKLTAGAASVQSGFRIVAPFVGIDASAAGAGGARLSRQTAVYYYFNGSEFNLLANVSAPNNHFTLYSNMSRIGLGEFSIDGSAALSTGLLDDGAWYVILISGTVPGGWVEAGQVDLVVNASGPTGATAAARFTAVMNVQPRTVDPSVGGATTDWRDLPDLTNATGIVIERMAAGAPQVRVTFSSPLDLCDPATPGTVLQLASSLRTGRGMVYLNASALPAFNSSAEVIMFGLTEHGHPGILADGVPAVMAGQASGGPVSGLTWNQSSGELAFTVSSWAEFVADGVAPYAVEVNMAGGQFTPDPTPTVTFRVNDTLSGVNASSAVFAFDGDGAGLQVVVTGNWSSGWYIGSTARALTDGWHLAWLTVYDNVGNAAMLSVDFYVDTTPPQIAGQTPTSGLITREAGIGAGASLSDSLSGVACAWIFVDGANCTAQATVAQSGIYYAPQSALAEGWHNITVAAFDAVGNNATAEWSYAVDLTPPHITYSHPPNGMIVPLNSSLYIDYADNFGVDASLTRLYVDGGDVTAAATVSGGHIIYAPAPMLAKGVHQVGVYICDAAGNGAASNWSFTVDNVPPSIVINSPTNGSTHEAKAVAVSVIYYDNLNVDKSSVLIKVDGDNVTPSATISETSLAYQATLDWGKHKVEVWVTDNSGNTGYAASIFTLSEPTIPPGLIQDFLVIAAIMMAIVGGLVAVFVLGNKKRKVEV